jgi:RNase P/RNase MRP subunit p29
MSLIGEEVTVISSTDPRTAGRAGRVVLETANTLLVESEGSRIRIEKRGASFMLGSGVVVAGSDIQGRLQDRLGKRKP